MTQSKQYGIRIILFLLILSMVGSLLAACGNTPDVPDESKQGTTPDETSGQNQETEPAGDVKVFSAEDLNDFKIVRSDLITSSSDPVIQAATSLRKAIKTATGANVGIGVDWLANKEEDTTQYKEILIGETNRAETAAAKALLGENQYLIMISESGTKIVIIGSDSFGTIAAVNYVINTLLGYDEAAGTYAKNSLAVPEKLIVTYQPPTDFYNIDASALRNSFNNENDQTRFIVSFQGIYNRDAKEKNKYLFVGTDSTDDFWRDFMQSEGHYFEYSRNIPVTSFRDFYLLFEDQIKELGVVLWDTDVPSTANVAATICGVEGCLPVRYDESSSSLYTYLVTQNKIEVKHNLVGMFENAKIGSLIADTNLASTGSSKCDAYIWALDQYMSKTNDRMIAYTLDGAGTIPTNQVYLDSSGHGPDWNQIFSHDYLIMNRCFFFDLTITGDEAPNDDPTQPLGTDRATCVKIMQTMYERAGGNMIELMGFPPWYMKYTTTGGHGKVAPTVLEWQFVEFITSYNAFKEADAAHPAWMTNGSVYSQYELKQTSYENHNRSAMPDVTYDSNTRYFTIYLGDYDSSAWMKAHIPGFFQDKARGTLPLMWAFNPNLSRRVPMVFEYVFENLTDYDFVVAGDSGAGYVIPSALIEPSLRGGRPSGAQAWIDWCKPYMEKFNMDIVGFIINGNNRVNKAIFEMYNKIAPVGSFHNDSSKRLYKYDGTLYLHLQNGIDPDGGEKTYQTMLDYMNNGKINFAAYRTVCKSPSQIKACVEGFIEYAEAHSDYTYVYVDPYTLFDMIEDSRTAQEYTGS
ncbi:MAG: hypothetical protein IJU20_02365 [Clostridia bacterium]|nr:hypothetical protein [Clostridia bacterium]